VAENPAALPEERFKLGTGHPGPDAHHGVAWFINVGQGSGVEDDPRDLGSDQSADDGRPSSPWDHGNRMFSAPIDHALHCIAIIWRDDRIGDLGFSRAHHIDKGHPAAGLHPVIVLTSDARAQRLDRLCRSRVKPARHRGFCSPTPSRRPRTDDVVQQGLHRFGQWLPMVAPASDARARVWHHHCGSLSHVMSPDARSADLSPERRIRDIADAGARSDLLVIGGGITGVGIALDAASRGLSVTLLERRDLSFGTSRWSSKLIHGGLRYLASGDVALAWESARERAVLMTTIAPFLIRPLAHVFPILRGEPPHQAGLTRLGLAAGDVLRIGSGTRRSTLPGARTISRARTARLLPGIDNERLRGGLLWWDGSLEDDARLTIAVARTAASFDARILTGFEAIAVTGDRVVARDTASGASLEFHATHVVNATGVWAPQLDPATHITVSRGSHLVLRSDAVGSPRAAMTVQVDRGRYCFLLPRPDNLVLAGITDEPQPGPVPDVPEPPTTDIDWIVQQVSRALQYPIRPSDIVGAFAGLRPLADTGPHATADLSRRHVISHGADGVWTIVGGKLTTYRKMAQDLVDRLTTAPCRTRSIPLIGAGPLTAATRVPIRLIRRYGSEAPRVAALADENPSLLQPVAPGVPTLGVEFVFGITAEGARTVDDVLTRRTRIDLVRADVEAATPLAEQLIAEYV
jgi:glycerol-3-phosphate dehydrogenase